MGLHVFLGLVFLVLGGLPDIRGLICGLIPKYHFYQIEHVRKQRLRPYDTFLKNFQYSDALDAALESRHALIVVSLLDELIQRDCLQQVVL